MMGDWTFFSNHGHVFFCLARDGDARLRDVAADVGITERAVQKIVRDLEQAGYIEVRKQGRCNRYRINRRKSLRHPLESHCSVSKLVNLVAPGARAAAVVASAATEPVAAPQAHPPAEATPEPEHKAAAAPEPKPAPVHRQEEPGDAPPSSKPEAPPQPVPAAGGEAGAETGEPAVPAGEKQDARKEKARRKGKSEPVDVRKQGSLF